MRFIDAKRIIDSYKALEIAFPDKIVFGKLERITRIKSNKKGYMVNFEVLHSSMLYSNHFPEKHEGEALIADLDTAWECARLFAKMTQGTVYNVYVVDNSFSPVDKFKSMCARTIYNQR